MLDWLVARWTWIKNWPLRCIDGMRAARLEQELTAVNAALDNAEWENDCHRLRSRRVRDILDDPIPPRLGTK